MKRTLYVGSAQIAVSGDIAQNRNRILDTLSDSAQRGLEVVLFPETAISGYSPELGVKRQPDDWGAIRGALGDIQRHCAQRGIWAIVGADVYTGTEWRNREYAISSRGEIEGYYDKVHLTGDDWAYYAPGLNPTILEISGVKVGLQICYDLRFPEGYRHLLERGVQIVMQGFYGAGGSTWKVPVMAAHLVSRAAETGCYMVACNVGNPLQIMRSAIVDPLGLIVAQANQDAQETIAAVLDMARVDESTIRRDYVAHFKRPEHWEGAS